jgi:hypothetical protein
MTDTQLMEQQVLQQDPQGGPTAAELMASPTRAARSGGGTADQFPDDLDIVVKTRLEVMVSRGLVSR